MSATPFCYSSDSDCENSMMVQTKQKQHQASPAARVLPLESFYRAVLVDLLTSRSNDFFDFIFGQLFSRKVKGNLNGKAVGYEELHAHFCALRATYFAHTADGVLRFGPFLASSKHGERDGYLAAASVVASLAQDSAENHAAGQLHYNALMVTDTLEVQWVEGKAGESRRITRFDRTTTRPVRSP